TARPTLAPAVLPLASTSTPPKPTSRASARRPLMRSPKNCTPTSAVNNTVSALAMAPTPAGARSAAQAYRLKGIAELIAPIIASFGHSRSGNRERARHRKGNRISAPRASRTSTRASGPKSGAATRRNMKDAPQIAPRTINSRVAVGYRAAAVGREEALATEFMEGLPRAELMPVANSLYRHEPHKRILLAAVPNIAIGSYDPFRMASRPRRLRGRGPAPELRPCRRGTQPHARRRQPPRAQARDRKSTRLNSSHANNSYAVFS